MSPNFSWHQPADRLVKLHHSWLGSPFKTCIKYVLKEGAPNSNELQLVSLSHSTAIWGFYNCIPFSDKPLSSRNKQHQTKFSSDMVWALVQSMHINHGIVKNKTHLNVTNWQGTKLESCSLGHYGSMTLDWWSCIQTKEHLVSAGYRLWPIPSCWKTLTPCCAW